MFPKKPSCNTDTESNYSSCSSRGKWSLIIDKYKNELWNSYDRGCHCHSSCIESERNCLSNVFWWFEYSKNFPKNDHQRCDDNHANCVPFSSSCKNPEDIQHTRNPKSRKDRVIFFIIFSMFSPWPDTPNSKGEIDRWSCNSKRPSCRHIRKRKYFSKIHHCLSKFSWGAKIIDPVGSEKKCGSKELTEHGWEGKG